MTVPAFLKNYLILKVEKFEGFFFLNTVSQNLNTVQQEK